MSSRRSLKKNIKNTMGLLYTECLFYKVFVIDADQKAADNLMIRIVEAESDLLKRANVSEGKYVKGRVKAYYKKLNTDTKDQVNAIAKEIAALG